MPQALGKDKKTFGKGFAECNTRQKAHDIYSVGKQLFAEYFLIAHSANGLPSVKFDTRQKKVVCRVFLQNTLGKGLLFAECFWNYTRQTYFPKKKKYLQVLIGILAALIL